MAGGVPGPLLSRRGTAADAGGDRARAPPLARAGGRGRAAHAGTWYLKPFLDTLIGMVRRTPGRARKSDAHLLAIVYEFLGASHYFATSTTTLTQMYGKEEYERLKRRYADELRLAIRARLSAPD